MHRALHWWTALVAGAVLSLGLCAVAAPANTWHDNRGGTYSPGNYAGGFSGAVILPVVWTVAGTPLNCTLITPVGTISAGTASGTAGSTTAAATWVNAMTGTISYVCTNAGAMYKLTCTFGWTATNYNANTPTTYLLAAGKVTDGTFDFTAASGNGCALRLNGQMADCKNITGSIPASYRNPRTLTNAIPNAMATTSTDAGFLVPAVPVGPLTAAAGTGACPGIGNGNVTVGIGDLQLVSAQPQPVFWVTNP